MTLRRPTRPLRGGANEARARRLAALLGANVEVFRADGDDRFTVRVTLGGEVRITPTSALTATNAWRWAREAIEREAEARVRDAFAANFNVSIVVGSLRRAEVFVDAARAEVARLEAQRDAIATRGAEAGRALADRLAELDAPRRALFDALVTEPVGEVPRG